MLRKTTARHAARSMALVTAMALAACGGGGGSDGDGNAPVVDGKDKAAVANQALAAVQLAIRSEELESSSMAQAKATTSPCSHGGSVEEASTSGQPGDVPFPAAATLVYTIDSAIFRDCVLSDETDSFPDPDGNGPQTGSTVRSRVVLTGVTREGDAANTSNQYRFASWGSGATPQRTTLQARVDQNGQVSDVTLTLDSLLRSDARHGNSDWETLVFGSFDFGAQGQVGGERAGVSGEIRVGTGLDQRLRIAEDAQGVRIDGQYRIDLDRICEVTVDVATVTPLRLDASSVTTGGELLVTVNGVRSLVSYGTGGSITVTEGGSSRSFERDELLRQQASTPCGFAAFSLFPAGPL